MTDDDWRTRYEAIRAAFPDKNLPLHLNPPNEQIGYPHLFSGHEYWHLQPTFLVKYNQEKNRSIYYYPSGDAIAVREPPMLPQLVTDDKIDRWEEENRGQD